MNIAQFFLEVQLTLFFNKVRTVHNCKYIKIKGLYDNILVPLHLTILNSTLLSVEFRNFLYLLAAA